jgi:hypothetical protein
MTPNKTRNLFATIFAAALSGAAPAALASADPDSTVAALADKADEAGTAAGIVNQCRSDAAPIQSAFLRALDDAGLDYASRRSLLDRYRMAETSTLKALSGSPMTDCADTNGIIRDTIHRLEMPES